ncbi:MAG: DUF192 domain-containing protein [Patescibacteria group bacterium]
MKKILAAFAVLLIVIAGGLLAQNYFKTQNIFQIQKNSKATINNNAFQLIVVNTPKEMEIGLSETTSLPQDKGMLFLFKSPGYHSFWMKNMKIPIDIIFINKDKIVTIFSKVNPPSNESPTIYRPDEPSDKVLEINSGLSEKYDFKKGDKVVLENI